MDHVKIEKEETLAHLVSLSHEMLCALLYSDEGNEYYKEMARRWQAITGHICTPVLKGELSISPGSGGR